MSIERVIATFIGIGVALCIAIALMPVAGSVVVFLVAVVGGAVFLVKGLRDLRRQPSPWVRPQEKHRDEPARRPAGTGARVVRLVPRNRPPPDQPSHV